MPCVRRCNDKPVSLVFLCSIVFHTVVWNRGSVHMRLHVMEVIVSLLRSVAPAFAILAASPLAFAGAGDYRFDPVHTQILFAADHLGFSHPQGRLHVKSGFIHFDSGDWAASKVDAVIDTASLDMGDAAWNAKLHSWEFLDTGKYPTAHFVSTAVEKTGERSGVVHGQFTLRGVTRPLDLAITFNRAGADPYSLKYTAGFSATATLKRAEFGMKKYLPDVGDKVDIHIEAEGLRDRDAQEQAAHDGTEH
jgi:polyisoprenoid-binding protein YceI